MFSLNDVATLKAFCAQPGTTQHRLGVAAIALRKPPVHVVRETTLEFA